MTTRERDAREAIARLQTEKVAIHSFLDRDRRDRRDAIDRLIKINHEIKEWSRHIPTPPASKGINSYEFEVERSAADEIKRLRSVLNEAYGELLADSSRDGVRCLLLTTIEDALGISCATSTPAVGRRGRDISNREN